MHVCPVSAVRGVPMRSFFRSMMLLFMFMLSFGGVSQVAACSGGRAPGGFPLDYFLTSAEMTVAGRILTLSESRINAILDIDYYLQGGGDAQFLLLSQENHKRIALIASGRPYPVRCSYLSDTLESGEFIAGLSRNGDGSYRGHFLFPDADGWFTVSEYPDPQRVLNFTYEDMIQYIAARVDQTPQAPTTHMKPRAVQVQLVTTSGETYQLPVDRNTLEAIATTNRLYCNPWGGDGCTQHIVAPNGIDSASLYPMGSGMDDSNSLEWPYSPAFEGQGGVFSATSELITIWSDNTLRVFVTAAQRGISAYSYYSVQLLTTFTSTPSDPLITGAGAWSSDGRTFAFSTQSGIWLWDALTLDSQPYRLLSANDEPISVRHFSPQGNYLALETASTRYHVDIHSLHTYPDGLLSPDDRLLAVYDMRAVSLTPMRLHTLKPEFQPLMGWDRYSTNISQFEWTSNTSYILAACGEAIFDPEIPPGFDEPWCKVFVSMIGHQGTHYDGTAFDYDALTQSLATLVDGDTIMLNGEILDFAGQLSSDIVRIELIPLIDLDYRQW